MIRGLPLMLMVALVVSPTLADEQEQLIIDSWLTQAKDGVIQIFRTPSSRY